ncbi:MAG: LamG domain-containing protein [Candidatus Moraniibacteriota bacterium]
MSYDVTKSRIFQWLGIILILAVFAGAYWYFKVYGSTLNAPQNDLNTNGLVGLWSFNGDDISGVTAYDRSGQGNNGTLTSGPTATQGKVGQALSFDGADDSVSITGDIIGTGADSVCAWVYPRSVGENSYGRILSGAIEKFIFIIDFSSKFALLSDGSTAIYSPTISLNRWTFACATRDAAGAGVIYMDGVAVSSGSTGTPASNGATTYIGNRSTGDRTFDGSIDEVRIYNRALSAGEIQSLYTQGSGTKVDSAVSQPQGTGRLDSGLAGYWKLDDGSGTSITNSATIGGTTSLTGTPSWTTGQIGSAVDFDGVDDTAAVTYNTAFTSSNALTYSFWAKPDLNEGNGILGSLNGENGSAYNFIIIDNNGAQLGTPLISLLRNIGGTATRSVQFTYPVSTWFHYTYTYDGANERVYINGAQAGEWAQTGSFASNTEYGLVFGRAHTTAIQYYDGALDEVRMYNRPLSSDEVSQLYRLTAPTSVDTGLKGYWSFNGKDVSGTTAYDRSGAGNTGTLTNGPTVTDGKVGQALSFDGADDYVNIPDSTALDIGDTDDLTLTGWFYRDTSTTEDTIVAKRNGLTSPYVGYIAYLDAANDELTFEVSDGVDEYSLTSVSTFTTTGWHQYAIVWDQASATNSDIYIDGVANGATDTGTIGNIGDLSNALVLAQGAESDANNPFDGRLDEFRFYNRALTATEIQSLYALGGGTKVNSSISQNQGTGRIDSGLAGYWAMDEGSGTSATDASTNGNTGTLTNGPTWTTGQVGGAVTFDGTDDYIDVGTAGLTSPTKLSGAAWIKIDDVVFAESYNFFSNRSASNHGWTFGTSGGAANCSGVDCDMLRFTIQGVASYSTTDRLIIEGQWTHVAFTWNGSSVSLYVNGRVVQTFSTGSMITGSNLLLGVQGPSPGVAGMFMDGLIDEARIYDRALSADEVEQLYLLTAPTGVDTGLKGYWSFNGKDVSGTTAYDRSGVGNTGTLTNGPAITEGQLGQALNFDGTDDYVDAGDIASADGGTALTYAAWVYQDSLAVNKAITAKWTYQTQGSWAIQTDFTTNTKLQVFIPTSLTDSGSGASATTPTSSWSAGVWHHVVFIYDGSQGTDTNRLQVYIDGISQTLTFVGTMPTSMQASTAAVKIGQFGGTLNRPWNGKIDEVRIYNRALTAAEIAALYNSSR